MPPVVAAIPALVASAVSVAAPSFSIGGFLASTAISVALGGLSRLLADKPKMRSGDSLKSGLTQQFRQAVTYREVVYGEVRKSGPVTFIETTDNNDYMHYIITLASHEITAIDEYLVSDESITPDMIDEDGTVNAGSYAGEMRLKPHLGADTQEADSDLVAEVERWTSYHRQRGNAYLYIRMKWDANIYPSGLPNISVWMRGKKMIDSRDYVAQTNRVTESGEQRITEDGLNRQTEDIWDTASRVYSANVALQVFDHMTDKKWGMGIAHARIEEPTVDITANVCDEMVACKNVTIDILSADVMSDILTLDREILQLTRGDQVSLASSDIGGLSEGVNYYVIPYQRQDTPRIKLAASLEDAMQGVSVVITGDGTATLVKDAEPRYHGGGVLSMEAERGSNLDEITSGMGGYVIDTGGKYALKAAVYETPIYSFDEGDLAGPLEILQTRASIQERFNHIQGLFSEVGNKGNAADYPAVKSDTYIAEDGEVKEKKLDLVWTNRSNTGQRLAKIAMEMGRRDLIFSAPFKLCALKLRSRDNFYFSFAGAGWENVVFQVLSWRLYHRDQDGVPEPVIEMTCQIMDANVFAFSYVEDEKSTIPAPRTSLPSAFSVELVKGFSLQSIPVNTLHGDKTYKIKASWTTPNSRAITSGGYFEIYYKDSSSSVWTNAAPVRGAAHESELFQAQLDTQYDIKIRAVNALGKEGSFNSVYGFVVGTSLIADVQDWQFDTLSAEDWQNDTLTAEDWSS